jgi:hypothetical protein
MGVNIVHARTLARKIERRSVDRRVLRGLIEGEAAPYNFGNPGQNPSGLSVRIAACPVPTSRIFSVGGSSRFHQPPPSA